MWGLVLTFGENRLQNIRDENLRAAGFDPEVERFHRALLAADPSQRLPSGPSGVADEDCVPHDVLDPDANEAAAKRLFGQNLATTAAMGFAGGRSPGAPRSALLVRSERRSIMRDGCRTCAEPGPLPLNMNMRLSGPTFRRTIGRGERVSDLLDELVRRTRQTGNEHGIFSLQNGERVLIEGGRSHIYLPSSRTAAGESIHTRRVIAHTHPSGSPYPSHAGGDIDALRVLGEAGRGQQHSYIVAITQEGRVVRRFDRPPPVDWATLDAHLAGIGQSIGR